jgi:hypothetical protein
VVEGGRRRSGEREMNWSMDFDLRERESEREGEREKGGERV